ncbi:hypothetical protein F5B21DRAFT_494984 [Xylaria acuta]|nr:hypothetical protein F5B21DRAFT_494984 [Xylaria acuta]
MASPQPPLTRVPAPPIDVPGLSCTGTMCGSSVNYECHRIPVGECAAATTYYEFEHLLKPHFWIFAALILYFVVGNTTSSSSEDAYGAFLRLLAKLRLGPNGRPQPRARTTQIAALLAYVAILWLVWTEEYMVLSTEWRIARKVLAVLWPRPTPLRLRLLVLYPAWAVAFVVCVALMALTFFFGAGIIKAPLGCVREMASLVMGGTELHSRVLPGENHAAGDVREQDERKEKVNEAEAAETLVVPSGEKSSVDSGASA